MITFERKGCKVLVNLDSGIPVALPVWTAKVEFQGESVAEIMRTHFEKELADKMKEIRRGAYEQGWEDKASHRHKKSTRFCDEMDPHQYHAGCW